VLHLVLFALSRLNLHLTIKDHHIRNDLAVNQYEVYDLVTHPGLQHVREAIDKLRACGGSLCANTRARTTSEKAGSKMSFSSS
jgi:hypothetical protein